jgi:hypothetical protein
VLERVPRRLRVEGWRREPIRRKRTRTSYEAAISILTHFRRDCSGLWPLASPTRAAALSSPFRKALTFEEISSAWPICLRFDAWIGAPAQLAALARTERLPMKTPLIAALNRLLGALARSILLLLAPLTIADAQAAPPTDWHRLLPSEVLPTDQFQLGDFDVAHGKGIFVGFGGDGAVATSSDGVNWKPVLPATFDYIGSVAYGGGTFVAVGTEKVHTSTNGTQWVSQSAFGAYDTLHRVRYLNGLFVATGTDYVGFRWQSMGRSPLHLT